MQGKVIGGDQAFNQYIEFPLQATSVAGLTVLCIQQLEHQSEAVGNRLSLYGYNVLLLV